MSGKGKIFTGLLGLESSKTDSDKTRGTKSDNDEADNANGEKMVVSPNEKRRTIKKTEYK